MRLKQIQKRLSFSVAAATYFTVASVLPSSFDRQAQKALFVPSQKVTVSLPKNTSQVVIHTLGADGNLISKNATISNDQLNMDASDAVSFVEIGGSAAGD